MRKNHKDNDFANEFIDAAWELAKAYMQEPPRALQQPEIIRCKECKYYDKDSIDMSGFFFCEKITTQMDFDDYCSYAERKEENDI